MTTATAPANKKNAAPKEKVTVKKKASAPKKNPVTKKNDNSKHKFEFDFQELASRAMLVSFQTTAPSFVTRDKKVTQEVADRNKVEVKVGSYVKKLIKSDLLKNISNLNQNARIEYYKHSQEWSRGMRIIPTENYDKLQDGLNKIFEERKKCIYEFLRHYDSIVEDQKNRLGPLFSEDDYPPVSKVESKFNWKLTPYPVPTSDDFRIDFTNEVLDEIKQEMEQTVVNQLRSNLMELWEQLTTVVADIKDRMTDDGDEPKRFKKNLFTNLEKMVDTFEAMNFTKDRCINKMVAEAKSKLAKYDATDLRKSPEKRSEIAEAASELYDTLMEMRETQQQ